VLHGLMLQRNAAFIRTVRIRPGLLEGQHCLWTAASSLQYTPTWAQLIATPYIAVGRLTCIRVTLVYFGG